MARRDTQTVLAFLAAIGGLAFGVAVGLALPLFFADSVTPKFRLVAPAVGGTFGFIIAGGLAARFAGRVVPGSIDGDERRRR